MPTIYDFERRYQNPKIGLLVRKLMICTNFAYYFVNKVAQFGGWTFLHINCSSQPRLSTENKVTLVTFIRDCFSHSRLELSCTKYDPRLALNNSFIWYEIEMGASQNESLIFFPQIGYQALYFSIWVEKIINEKLNILQMTIWYTRKHDPMRTSIFMFIKVNFLNLQCSFCLLLPNFL